ncbi:MAG TPA: adventurous gliding motility protein CglE [bacterium]|nr:adventurous gliding motility protein CglE [bacterium]
MTKTSIAAALLLMLASSAAWAQTPPATGSTGSTGTPATKPAQRPQPPEIVHGFYTEFDFGAMKILGGDAGSNSQAGVMAGFAIGADVGNYLKVEGRMLNSTQDGNGKIYEFSEGDTTLVQKNPCPDGSSGNACVAWPDIQVSLVTADLKLVYPVSDRMNVHALVGAGAMLANPSPTQMFKFDPRAQVEKPNSIQSGNSPVFGAGAGIEYYTHLRHFSVGGDLAIWSASGGMALTIFPTIKYTF